MSIILIFGFQDVYLERRKREEERRKAVTLLSKKSPKSHHLTIEQRHYQMKIKELRAKSERRGNNNNSDPETDGSAPEEKDREREPRLTNITSEYDLKLFQEALAVASEKIVICSSFSVYCLHSLGACLEYYYMFQYTRKFAAYSVTIVCLGTVVPPSCDCFSSYVQTTSSAVIVSDSTKIFSKRCCD